MPPDDTQHRSPTASDHDRPRPTMTDQDGQRPTLQDQRRDDHTLTTREVMQLFEDSGLPRNQRSIERYCDQGKLDCFKDPDELRYYITRASAERLIGHQKEIQGRQHAVVMHAPPSHAQTPPDRVGPSPTAGEATASVKRSTSAKSESETTREEYEHTRTDLEALQARFKTLENDKFNLEIDKRARDQVIGMMREQITNDRKDFVAQITEHAHRVGQLETEMRQLKAPDHDRLPTPDDGDALDDGAAIDAEFSDAERREGDAPHDVSMHTQQP